MTLKEMICLAVVYALTAAGLVVIGWQLLQLAKAVGL